MSIEDLNSKIEQWNPMTSDYKNTEFNQYISGPGAALEFQPPQKALGNNIDKQNLNTPCLIFKNMPPSMTKQALNFLCSKHGRVTDIRYNIKKSPFFFVDFATVADMEAVLRALEKNNYGFEVVISSSTGKKRINVEINKNLPPVVPTKTGIDYESRNVSMSRKNHPRPKVPEDNLLNVNDALNTDLPLNLLANDAHALERQGLDKMPDNSRFSYRNGRSFVNMPHRMEEFADKKRKESSGTYIDSEDKFLHVQQNSKISDRVNKCSRCDYACDTVCERCSQYYCSVECQVNDWPEHRYKCGKPKHLQKTPPSKKELKSNKKSSNKSNNNNQKPLDSPKNSELGSSENSVAVYKQNMPRSGNIVSITSIIKTNTVFVRSITYDDNLSFFSTVDTLQSLGKLLKPLKISPKSGEVVITKFEGQFNRALVLKVINPDKVIINFMDYGNTEQARMEDLFEAPAEFIYKPRHAVPVLLKGVNDFYMTEDIRQFMHTYLNNINVGIRYKSEDFHEANKIYAVELIDESTQLNLNQVIMKLSKPVEPQNINEICDRSYLNPKKLPVGNSVELIVMDNSLITSGCISCTIKPYAIEIKKFKNDIQEYVKSLPEEAYTPRAEELCIAKYSKDNLWYRGVCIEVVGDGYPSIHFIDYGNITTVPIENIRRYPSQFTFPLFTFDCAIEDLPETCGPQLVEKLEELIPNGETIECENVTVDEKSNFYFISLPNIISELTECGLI